MVRLSMWVYAVLLLLIGASTAVWAGEPNLPAGFRQIGSIDFSNWPAQNWYTREKAAADWNPRLYNGEERINFNGIVHYRAMVVDNSPLGKHALRVLLPRDKISPAHTGIQIFADIGGYEEVYFGYSLYLPPDFSCGREVKLPPGIYGGWKFATGGVRPNGVSIGPSIRMVIQECYASSYVYHLGLAGGAGDSYGEKFAWMNRQGRQEKIGKGVKHDIMFNAAMNVPGKKNGSHKVWLDGAPVLSLNALELRRSEELKFDTVGVEIFRGGGNMSYAAGRDSTLDVTEFKVWVREY
ncbi:MAG: hypothetical protein Q8O93_01640 [bacterium]|nr:hypothetical protein [bacterium]